MFEDNGRIDDERFDGGRIALVTINRPDKLNALSHRLTKELDEVLARVDADPLVGCVVITGAGDRAFSAGFDLNEFLTWDKREFIRVMFEREPYMYRWADMAKPTIAAVNGVAHGAGAIMSTSVDFRIGCSKSEYRFTAISGNSANNTWQLPVICSMPKAKEFIFTAEPVSAEEADAAGFFTRMVEPGQVVPAALEFAGRIAANPVPGLVETKRLLKESIGRSLYDRYTAENATQNWILLNAEPCFAGTEEDGLRGNPHIQEWEEHISKKRRVAG